MEKIVWAWALVLGVCVWGDGLESQCLACHKEQQIPNHLIYGRYLEQYSAEKNIENAIYRYLINPQKEHSIMPPQFFLKFPMKEKRSMDETTLRQSIKQFIQKFDIKKKLVLDKSSH